MKILIAKTPDCSDATYEKILKFIDDLQYEFVGYLDENGGADKVYPLSYVSELEFDFVLIPAVFNEYLLNSAKQLLAANVPQTKIKRSFWLIQQFLTLKYENCDDKTILETLKYWKTNDIDAFNQHMKGVKDSLSEVYTDESCGLPYIIFEGVTGKKHKLYYPEGGGGSFYIVNGVTCVANINREQTSSSPHLYTKGSHKISNGDILIDAGVSQGNFALRYIDICSKVYLFEPVEIWLKPLWYTFKDFDQEVIMFPNFLSDVTKDNSITLDDAIPELRGEKIFLKMDIEGAEPAALRGGKNLLTNNKVKASACSYHNSNDIVKVKSLFKSYGYRTWASSGYMIFLYDPNIWDMPDFRKGVVYAENY